MKPKKIFQEASLIDLDSDKPISIFAKIHVHYEHGTGILRNKFDYDQAETIAALSEAIQNEA